MIADRMIEMEIFDFSEIEQKQLPLRLSNLRFSLKMVGLVLIVFVVKFVLKYHYQKFILFFAILYSSVMLSYPLIRWITKSYYLAILSFYFTTINMVCIMIFMSGGIRAPGNIWFALIPFLGTSLLGRRGFFWGVYFAVLPIIIFIILNQLNIEMYPFVDIASYQFEFRVNLIIFLATSFYFTYYHMISEYKNQYFLNQEKEKNENLLRILFHDLANPMQTIRLLLKKMIANRNPEDIPKLITQLNKTSLRIVEILEHVRKIKGIENKKIILELKKCRLMDCILKTRDLFEDRMKEKSIEIEISKESDEHIEILVDEIYFIHQVLGNIISNAIKFSDEGENIFISWEKNNDKICLSIQDHGLGIPSDILDNIFDQSKFNSRKGTRGEIGTGYGMSLVKTFINEFNGNVEIFSQVKESGLSAHGTKIIIKLPFAA